jgi:hypothetical protein
VTAPVLHWPKLFEGQVGPNKTSFCNGRGNGNGRGNDWGDGYGYDNGDGNN